MGQGHLQTELEGEDELEKGRQDRWKKRSICQPPCKEHKAQFEKFCMNLMESSQ